MKGNMTMKTFLRLKARLLASAGTMLAVATAGALDFSRLASRSASASCRAETPDFCRRTSRQALKSCRSGAESDYSLAIAKCENVSDPAARRACRKEALADLRDTMRTCNEQFAARQVVCDRLGGAPYDPVIN